MKKVLIIGMVVILLAGQAFAEDVNASIVSDTNTSVVSDTNTSVVSDADTSGEKKVSHKLSFSSIPNSTGTIGIASKVIGMGVILIWNSLVD